MPRQRPVPTRADRAARPVMLVMLAPWAAMLVSWVKPQPAPRYNAAPRAMARMNPTRWRIAVSSRSPPLHYGLSDPTWRPRDPAACWPHAAPQLTSLYLLLTSSYHRAAVPLRAARARARATRALLRGPRT